MKLNKKLLLTLTLFASHSARADWADLIKWAREKGLLTPIGIAPLPCNDKRIIHDTEYLICPDSNFEGKDFKNANLAGADLRRANLKNAHLESANLSDANLAGANLEGAHLKNAILKNTNLTEAKLNNAHLANAVLRGANLSKANITNANFAAADLTDCKIDGITQFAGAHGNVYRDAALVAIQNLISGTSTPQKKQQLRIVYPGAASEKYFPPKKEAPEEPTKKRKAETELSESTKRLRVESKQPITIPAVGAIAPAPAHMPLQQPGAPVGRQEPQTVIFNAQPELTTQQPVKALEQHPKTTATIAERKILKLTKKPTLPATPSPTTAPAGVQPTTETQETQYADREVAAEVATTTPALPATPSPETAPIIEEKKVAAEEQPQQPTKTPTVKKEARAKSAVIEQPKPVESTLIKRYLTKVDLLFTKDVKLNNNYVHSLNALGEMVQPYPALVSIHIKYVQRPGIEFHTYLPKAEAGLQHKKYVENRLTDLLEDLFKKIRTTLWSQDEMKKWVADIIAQAFDKKESVKELHGFNRATGEMENMKDITITYTRRGKDKNAVINAVKESFTTRLKNTIRPLMNAQAPIAQMYAYFDEINNQLNAITFRDTAIGPMINLHNSLLAAVYEKDKKLKPEFAPFKKTIDALLVQMDKKVALPNAEDMDSRYERTEEVRKAFRVIRETMNRDYEKRGKP